MARHILNIRTVVLRYSKALLLLIATTVATLGAAGLVEHAIRIDPAGGAFTGLDGAPGPHGGTAVATNGLLHGDVLSYLTPE